VFGRIGANAFQAAAKEVAAVGGKSFQPHLEKRWEILTNLSGKGGKIFQICLEKAGKVFNPIWKKRLEILTNLSGKGGKSFQPHLEMKREILTNLSGKGGKSFQPHLEKKAGNSNKSVRKRWENFPNLSGKGGKF
jgi:hypothetical protein